MENAEEFDIEDQPENEEERKKRPVIKNAMDLQRLKLEKLMKCPEKPIVIPEPPKERDFMQSVPTFVRNVMGSSAGAGSGEFHVYRHLRRKEYARQKYIQAKSIREQLDEEYRSKIEQNKLEAEAKTAKKRAKRLKKKQRMKEKGKRRKTLSETEKSLEDNDDKDTSNSDESEKSDGEQCNNEGAQVREKATADPTDRNETEEKCKDENDVSELKEEKLDLTHTEEQEEQEHSNMPVMIINETLEESTSEKQISSGDLCLKETKGESNEFVEKSPT